MKIKIKKNIVTGTMLTCELDNDDIVAAKDIDTLYYESMKSAYNPNYIHTNKIIRVAETELYGGNSRNHTKDIFIIDGDVESVVGYALTTKEKKDSTHFNILLDPNLLLVSSNPGKQYMEKRIRTKEKNNDKLLLKDTRGNNRRIINRNINQNHIRIIKETSMTESNVQKSREYRNKKRA